MRNTILILVSLVCFNNAFAQEATSTTNNGTYWKSASEFIFSLGSVDAMGPDALNPLVLKPIDVTPVLRFTGFFHLQQQLHYDFNKNIGLFTGLGIRNVGMINKLNDSIKVKQRVYSLGVPVAIKFGDLPDGFYVAVGGEAELFFHYKQKVFYDDEKFKKSEWFSDKVNLFNPSVFLDITSSKGGYIRFKYYLTDFLVSDKQDIKTYGNSYTYIPEKSTLFYVSIGTTIKTRKGSHNKVKTDKTNTAMVNY